MKKILSIFLITIFFFGNSQKIFAGDQCQPINITNYFIGQEKKYYNTDDLKKYILERKKFFNNSNPSIKNIFKSENLQKINEINQNFIDLQNQKFSLAIQYVLKKFNEEDLKKKGEKINDKDKSEKILEKFKTGTGSDFFIKKFLEKKDKKNSIINKNPKNIPTSVLQKSVYLDFLIFSCELGKFKGENNFQAGGMIKNLMSKSDSVEFEKNEILEKQQIVVRKAISKYQSFLTHREMYVALRGVVVKLEHLRWRFEDFARLIGFLPAKLVDFGYEKK